MNSFADRMNEVAAKVAQEKGGFLLFALVLRVDSWPHSWDVVVAAPWASENKPAAREYLIETVKATLGQDALQSISAFIILDAGDPSVREYSEMLRADHGKTEVRNGEFFGVPTPEAYVLTS